MSAGRQYLLGTAVGLLIVLLAELGHWLVGVLAH